MEEKNNELIFSEKPYYTDEELMLYYTIAIDEFTKSGNEEMANRYRKLLRMVVDKDKKPDPLTERIINYNRNKNKNNKK